VGVVVFGRPVGRFAEAEFEALLFLAVHAEGDVAVAEAQGEFAHEDALAPAVVEGDVVNVRAAAGGFEGAQCFALFWWDHGG